MEIDEKMYVKETEHFCKVYSTTINEELG